MTDENRLDESVLTPSNLPVTRDERRALLAAVSDELRSFGSASRLKPSIDANMGEFEARMVAMFERLFNEIQPAILDLIDELTTQAEASNHKVISGLNAVVKAIVLENHRLLTQNGLPPRRERDITTSVAEVPRDSAQLGQEIEQVFGDIMAQPYLSLERPAELAPASWPGDADRERLTEEMSALRRENERLRSAIKCAYQLTQEINLYNFRWQKEKIIHDLGELLND